MKINNLELNVKTIGTGVPFVWGHGLMNSMALEDSVPWFKWEQLADIVKLVRYDARGHGQSEASYSPEDYHWSNLAQDMLAIAARLGFDMFIAGGQSMGCATTLYAAQAAPEQMKALVLANPPTAWETRAAQATMYDQMAGLIEARGLAALMRLMQQQPLVPAWQTQAYPDLNTAFLTGFQSFNEKALAQILRGASLCNLPAREELKSLTMPALILAWVDDPVHPLATAEELARLLPNSRLVVARNMDDVATWTQQIREFVIGLA